MQKNITKAQCCIVIGGHYYWRYLCFLKHLEVQSCGFSTLYNMKCTSDCAVNFQTWCACFQALFPFFVAKHGPTNDAACSLACINRRS